MNIIVCMKQAVDLEQIRIKADSRQPVLDGLPFLFGDFDKCAVEESVRIKEKHGGKITAVAAGMAKLKDTIKEALAIGADEAVILTDPAFQGSDTMGSARLLAKAVEKIGEYDLILLGDGSADNYSGQVPPLSAILKAGRKPVHTWGPGDLGITADAIGKAASTVEVLSNLAPLQDRKEIVFEDAEEGVVELVRALQREGVLEQ